MSNASKLFANSALVRQLEQDRIERKREELLHWYSEEYLRYKDHYPNLAQLISMAKDELILDSKSAIPVEFKLFVLSKLSTPEVIRLRELSAYRWSRFKEVNQ